MHSSNQDYQQNRVKKKHSSQLLQLSLALLVAGCWLLVAGAIYIELHYIFNSVCAPSGDLLAQGSGGPMFR